MMAILDYKFLLQFISHNIGTILLLCILYLLFNYFACTRNYFKDRGIPYISQSQILGSVAKRMLMKLSFHDFHVQIYKHFAGLPYGGYFEGRKPILLIRSPDLIKTVMIKEFDCFTDRHNAISVSHPTLEKMLLNLQGKEWKKIRALLTPVFTSAKLHSMEILLQECSEQMCTFLKNRPEGEVEVEMKEFYGRYSLEVIGSCAFGLDFASLKDPNAGFVQIAAKLLVTKTRKIIFFVFFLICPSILKLLSIGIVDNKVLEKLETLAMNVKKIREENVNSRRGDFMQHLLDMAQKEVTNNEEIVMTDTIIKAQVILFLFAGFETLSTILSFCCLSLCEHSDIQDKIREEIMEAIDKNDGKCDFEVINSIPLIKKVLLETLRMYTSVPILDRVCTKKCKIGELRFDVGDIVTIPIASVMRDPQYYPNPNVFDPERFTPEEMTKRPQELFLPFGLGRRNCIGLRFAMMAAKCGIFYLIKNFKLSPCSKTQIPVVFDKKGIFLKGERGIWLKLEEI